MGRISKNAMSSAVRLRERAAWQVDMVGMVQGIGFRPFVYRLAVRHGLAGHVLNDSRGASFYLEGSPKALENFWKDFWHELPPLAQVARWDRLEVEPRGLSGFRIEHSQEAQGPTVAFVTPDAHVCDDCLAEIRDPSQRRYRYPFTNCTNCGPRYTIITGVPYDRPNTTMVDFPMCSACRAEYEDPLDRRFHAQPIACPDCGPTLWAEDAQGRRLTGDPLRLAARALQEGRIVAIKGLGGFHLAVDARNEQAVRTLRARKWREAKPFALMVRDVQTARSLLSDDPGLAQLLESPARPIVLARRRKGAPVAPSVAPGLSELGIMLPYTPLHHLLFDESPPVLVMTSGNVSSEPLVSENQDARERLASLADVLLLHDRRIHNPCDDSVVRKTPWGHQMVRRARGYVPAPLVWEGFSGKVSLLALGPELKNTVSVTRPGQVVASQHLGDLTNPRAAQAFERAAERLAVLLGVEPRVVVVDGHPHYRSTRYGRSLAQERGLSVIAVQHHHAHMAACMLEHGLDLDARVVGVVWDGTGYGLDGTTWGGEFLVGGYQTFKRAAHLVPILLPGGDAATEHPWRIALSVLRQGGWTGPWPEPVARQDQRTVEVLLTMLHRGVRCAPSSGAGRLFDAAAALLDFHPEASDRVAYEAQLAIEMEALSSGVPPGQAPILPFVRRGRELDLLPALVELARRRGAGEPAELLAAAFIDTAAAACGETALAIARQEGLDTVVLSGGCFQNVRLTIGVVSRLEAAGLRCLVHEILPPNDGGVSVGQAAVGSAKILSER